MTRQEYIEELRKRLNGLSQEDLEDAIAYCEEYFEDAGIENEQQVIEELGTPAKYAAQIKAETAIRKNTQRRNNKEREKNPRTSMKNVVAIFLGICALPIAIPLLIVVVALFFSFIVVIASLLFSAVVCAAAVFMTGIPLIISGFSNIATPGNALIAFGGGLLSIGVALLLLLMFVWLIGALIPAFMKLITRLYHKAKGERHYE